MGKYKLVALDMDGTVLNEDNVISAENEKWIRAALSAGITVMFSTGRSTHNMLPYIEQLDLKTPIVAVNGSEVWKEPNVLLKRHFMETVVVRRMHELAEKYGTWFWAYSVEGIFNRDTWTDDVDSLQWLKFGYYTENEESRKHIFQTLQSWGTLEITNSHPFNLEINPIGINKASGIREVCTLLDIDMSEVVCMGDSLNDISMIRAAGLGVAMGNAQEEVKRVADIVTATNNEDGVAKVIREYVLHN